MQKFEPIQFKNQENNTRYACPFCAKIMKKRSMMRLHVRVHTGEKPFSCTVCNYKCNQKGALQSHMKRRHNILDIYVEQPQTEVLLE